MVNICNNRVLAGIVMSMISRDIESFKDSIQERLNSHVEDMPIKIINVDQKESYVGFEMNISKTHMQKLLKSRLSTYSTKSTIMDMTRELISVITSEILYSEFESYPPAFYKLQYLPKIQSGDVKEHVLNNMHLIQPYLVNVSKTGEKKVYLKINISH